MKHFISIVLILFQLIWYLPCHAEQAVVSGSVTLANIRLSLVNGTAFVDFSAAGTLTPYLGYKLVIKDSANKALTGYIKAVGAGETYDSELVTDGGLETWASATDATSWTEIIGGSSAVNREDTNMHGGTYAARLNVASGGAVEIKQTITFTAGRLYYSSFWFYRTGVGGDYFKAYTDLSGQVNFFGTNRFLQMQDASYTNKTAYGTATASDTGFGFRRNELSHTFAGYLDDVSIRHVLTPSATGVTIVSSAGGSTYNWTSEEAGFNRNDASGYTYAIYPGSFSLTIGGNNSTTGPALIDCANSAGMAGVDVTGTGNTLYNYTVVRCPAGGFYFDESATLKNSIGISSGNDISIAATKTVTALNNLFGDAAKTGDGTYSDAGATTLWATDPLFISTSDFHLRTGSPAINAGTDVGLTSDYAGRPVPSFNTPDIGAYEYERRKRIY